MKRLAKKARNGDKEALMQLVLDAKDEYYRLAYTYLENEHDAMDALENMIVILYEKIDQLQKPESFYSWSKTILVNECRALLRKRKKIIFLEQNQTEQLVDESLIATYQYSFDELLTSLSPVQKEAVQMKYFLDYDFETIAELTNVPVSTAKSRVFQALKKLRITLGGDNYEETR